MNLGQDVSHEKKATHTGAAHQEAWESGCDAGGRHSGSVVNCHRFLLTTIAKNDSGHQRDELFTIELLLVTKHKLDGLVPDGLVSQTN